MGVGLASGDEGSVAQSKRSVAGNPTESVRSGEWATVDELRPALAFGASQRPAHELRGRSIAMGLIGPIAIRPRQFDALVVPRSRVGADLRVEEETERLVEWQWRVLADRNHDQAS